MNQLRWLFLGVSVLIGAFSLETAFQAFFYIPFGLAVIFLLVFDGLYACSERGKCAWIGNHALVLMLFGQITLDIALITIGIALTGGAYSLLPLVYIFYFGVLEFYFSPMTLLGLNILAISSYLIVAHDQSFGWVFPSMAVDWIRPDPQNKSLMFLVLLALTINSLLVVFRSRQTYHQWQQIRADNLFLTSLNSLSKTAIIDAKDEMAFIGLAEEIKSLLGADNIYITHWDEDSQQVLSLAADRSVHEFYMNLPPTPRYENTFTRSVRQTGKPVVAENIFCTPYLSQRVARYYPSQSVLAAPMYGQPEGRFLGALIVAYNAHHYFAPLELARISQVIDILSLLISRTWLHEEAIRRAELLEKMAGQVTSLVSDLKHTTLLPSIVESARSLLQAQRAALHLHQRNGEMKCEYSVGLSDEFLAQLTRRFNQLSGGNILNNRDYLIIPDVQQDSRTSPVQDLIFGEKFRAYAVFSLNPGHEQKGALSLYWDDPQALSAEEISVGKLFAERAGALIRSADIYARATEEALTDILTGLPNRRHLDQRLRDEIERASRYGHSFAMLMIDLDGFKGVNDTFGHMIGDSVLKQFAFGLRRALRASDFLARYGGDEFSIILPETGLERALHVAEKLRFALTSTRLHLPQETQRYLSGCMGIAIYPKDQTEAEPLLACADQRMYRAKRSGSGSIIFKDE